MRRAKAHFRGFLITNQLRSQLCRFETILGKSCTTFPIAFDAAAPDPMLAAASWVHSEHHVNDVIHNYADRFAQHKAHASIHSVITVWRIAERQIIRKIKIKPLQYSIKTPFLLHSERDNIDVLDWIRIGPVDGCPLLLWRQQPRVFAACSAHLPALQLE